MRPTNPLWTRPWLQGLVLFALAFGIRAWSACAEDFPNLWDEQYHAAVAKSLLANPLEPRLLPNTGQPVDYRDWTANGIWLHKPPLFLWTLASSMAVWGTTVWGLRFPSVLLGALSALLVWRLGRRWGHPLAGWWGGLWLATGQFSASITAGRIPTDHNDVHFAFWVGLGLWTAARYMDRRTYGRAAAVGAAVGAAVLTKWLPGLWAGGVLGLWALLEGHFRTSERGTTLRHLVLAVGVASAVAVPWNVFIRSAYPAEASYEADYNARHLHEALEGHQEPLFFHFTSQVDLWGWTGTLLLLVGAGAALRQRSTRWMAVLGGILLVFGIYTYAATKMVAFTYALAVPLALFIGRGIQTVLRIQGGQVVRFAAATCVILAALLDNGRPWETYAKSRVDTPMRVARQEYADYFREYEATHPGERPVFRNVPKHALPLAVFFTSGTVDLASVNAQPELRALPTEKRVLRNAR